MAWMERGKLGLPVRWAIRMEFIFFSLKRTLLHAPSAGAGALQKRECIHVRDRINNPQISKYQRRDFFPWFLPMYYGTENYYTPIEEQDDRIRDGRSPNFFWEITFFCRKRREELNAREYARIGSWI